MGKVHVLMRKEDIDTEKIQGKIAVVFDVLLATSTIVAGLYYGAKEIIPVLHGKEALKEAENRVPDSFILVGEYEGITLEGFLNPNPLALKRHIQKKTVILSTTNGTVAIHKAVPAKRIYAASLLNGKAVARALRANHADDTIILVCAGSSGEFSMEDFYGAGYVLDCLLCEQNVEWEMTDAAFTAREFYRGAGECTENILLSSRVGQMLQRFKMEEDIYFIAQRGIFDMVPYLNERKALVKGGEDCYVGYTPS
ncbi:2-phosphosulfolactate phosphatase [Aneurinibacillus aneurinilyticus]|uniref:2-phosphosulfolactate phosphatase n=1 Tax=Aneurinibacillus aneurinilyticus TaxID=1391 RepID=UPI0023F57BA4|nr:2-phosphosulfolactate phosphatase [Aneurinibacillus aneurinilyticus]